MKPQEWHLFNGSLIINSEKHPTLFRLAYEDDFLLEQKLLSLGRQTGIKNFNGLADMLEEDLKYEK
jgi:hypothetical protein